MGRLGEGQEMLQQEYEEPRFMRLASEAGADDVLRGRDMLCFGHDWSGDPLSKTHVMRVLARDNRVLWINSIGYRAPKINSRDFRRAMKKLKSFTEPVREVEKNIFVLNPVAIPAYGSSFVRALNRRLLRYRILNAMRRLNFKRPINWVFNPSGSVVAGQLGEDLVVYYLVDDFTHFGDAGTRSMIEMDSALLARADLVVVSSERLFRSKLPLNPRTVLVRHGVDFDHYQKVFSPQTVVPPELAGLPRPIIGYFGLMTEEWIDEELLLKIARHFSSGSVVLLGSATMDTSRLAALPNVRLLGRKPFADLPAYCKGFDVAILPFPISEVTLSSNPLKVREYLAAGLPVVSTKIPEVEVLGNARIAATHEEFIHHLEDALHQPGPCRQRSESMKNESWEGRVEQLRGHVAALGVKRQGR
jgi:glycosyltransferase involved in cell wall biosynthesis